MFGTYWDFVTVKIQEGVSSLCPFIIEQSLLLLMLPSRHSTRVITSDAFTMAQFQMLQWCGQLCHCLVTCFNTFHVVSWNFLTFYCIPVLTNATWSSLFGSSITFVAVFHQDSFCGCTICGMKSFSTCAFGHTHIF